MQTFNNYLRQQQSEALWFGLMVTRLAGKTLEQKISKSCRSAIQKPVKDIVFS